jgi:hypothetical protein
MAAKRAPSLWVPVDTRSGTELRCYRQRSPLLTIRAGRPSLLVTLTLPERIEPGHVEFARQLAASAAAYAADVERRYRDLAPAKEEAA